jgi:PKHD-type hydroxylase
MLVDIPALLSKKKLSEIHDLITQAAFVDGKLSAGKAAQRVKNNDEIAADALQLQRLNNLVMTPLVSHPIFQNAALPHRVATPFFARYNPQQHYGEHIDDPVMGPMGQRYRSDVSITIFLSAPGDYQGGELRIHTSFGHHDVKLEAGDAILYPSSSLHQVMPVSSGTRLVAVTWAQSLIREPEKRELLYELHQARESLMAEKPDGAATKQVDHSYVNLVRMWSET